MRVFDSSSFKEMPWKNGGGFTLELFSLRKPNGDILFRLSSAQVKQDGPFSLFPSIERILFLLQGEGFRLKFPDEILVMDKIFEPITFQGEEEIFCELIDGECLDFNVMTDRYFGKSSLTIKTISEGENLQAINNHLFIYLPEEKKLIQLEQQDIYQHLYKETQAFIIDLKLK